jgi:hypothetical protein
MENDVVSIVPFLKVKLKCKVDERNVLISFNVCVALMF